MSACRPGAIEPIWSAKPRASAPRELAETIAAMLRGGKFRLIETAAERVAERLLADFRLPWLRLELRKPITTGGYTAIITLERARENP